MATILPSPLPPAREIPSSFASSVKSWWSAGEKEAAVSEERLLRKLPFFESSTWARTSKELPVTASSSRVTLSSAKRYINTLSILPTPASPAASPTTPSANPSPPTTTTTTPPPPPAVILHGYGAGLGFFFLNFPALGTWVAQRRAPAYALDWLGMGRSARPPFAIKAARADTAARVHEAEAFFIDALEEWRAAMRLERMTLVAHSLGAYLAVAYALRHPARVSRLVLLSPAGVPAEPQADTSVPARELTDDQAAMTARVEAGAAGGDVEAESRQRVKDMKARQKAERREQSRTQRIFTYLWEEGWSPFQIIRNLTVFGPLVVAKYSSRRFSGLTDEEVRNMNDYILNITLAKGSGEYCISHILAPFAKARLPLVDRIADIKVPVTFVYGDHDWMDPEGGTASVAKLRAAGNSNAKMYIIKNAGHHVYLDNPKAVNELLLKELSRSL